MGRKDFFSHGQSNSKRVCILINKNFDLPLIQLHSDDEGRQLIIQLTVEDVL